MRCGWVKLGCAAVLAAMCSGSAVHAQTEVTLSDESESPVRVIEQTNYQPPGGALPPVEVRPQPEVDNGADQRLPPAVVEPPPISPQPQFPPQDPQAPFNNDGPSTPGFPSLSDQTLGGNNGGTRGPIQSIFEQPRAASIVSQQAIRETAAIDIGQILEQTGGIMVQRTGRGQSSPFVRGLTGQQVLIMVDGVRMTNATFRAGPNQYFNTIDPNTIERIEVIRGPGSVLYGGDALGGVINVVTKQANYRTHDYMTGGTIQRFSSADLGYTGRVNVEGSVGSFGVFAGGGYGNYNNLDLGGNPDAPAGFQASRQQATSWSYYSADIKLRCQLTDWSEVVAGVQRYEGMDIFRSDRFPAQRESIFDPQRRELYFLRFQGENPCNSLISTYQITASLHIFDEGRQDRDFRVGRNPDLFSFRSFTDEQTGVTAYFTTDLDCFGTLSYGFDWYHDEIDSARRDEDRSVDPVAITDRDGAFPNDSYYSRYGGYLQWDVLLTERLQASAGVRFEHVTAGATVAANNFTGQIDPEYQDWIGQVGLTYSVSDEINLVGSISEGFRAPNLDDLAALNDNVFVGTQLPNPALNPEESFTYEIGARYNSSNLRSEVFVWWNEIDDYIVRGAPNNVNLLERTNAEAYLNGVEYSGEYLFNCDWSVYGNYWYTYGKNRTASEPLSRIPPMQGIVGVRRRWNCSRNWLDVYTWLVDRQDRLSARDLSDVNRIPSGGTPGYMTWNMRFGHTFSERQRIAVNLENIFDRQYRVHGSGSAGPGFNAIVTYELLH